MVSFFVYDNFHVGVHLADGRDVDVCHLRHPELGTASDAAHATACIAAALIDSAAIIATAQSEDGPGVTAGRLHAPVPRPRNVFGAPVNYAEHRGELGATRSPAAGTTRDLGLFVKASGSVSGPADGILLPALPGREIHYEGEIALVIGAPAEDVPIGRALDYVAGYTAALDMTLRLEEDCREERSMRKSYRTFTPIGPAIAPWTGDDLATSLSLRLSVNGEQRQAGSLNQLIVSAAELVSLASTIVPLEPGDLILTGTPSGVGQVVDGDIVDLSVDGLPDLSVRVIAKADVDGVYRLKEPAAFHLKEQAQHAH